MEGNMVYRSLVDHKRLWTGSYRRNGLVFMMVFAVACLFYSTEIMSKWNAEMWMKNQTKPLDKIYKSHRHVSSRLRNRNSSRPTLHPDSATSANTKIVSATSEAAADFPSNSSSPVVPDTRITSTAQQRTLETALMPPPVPYVSPGPYLVEYPYKYHFIINEPLTCQQEKPFLVLIVPVAPHNKAHRDIIRATWGKESSVSGKVVKLFFLLGLQEDKVQEQLVQESKVHRDLIQSDFIDCYKNLTIKTMVMLEWLDSYCPGISYTMKIDSDMFLNVAKLVNMLINAPKTNYMTGLVAHNAAVLRDPNSKWYLPFDIYPYPRYPRYALGLGYILSFDLVKKIIKASREVKPVYIEDVFLGLCMQRLGITPADPPSWDYFHVFPLMYNRCRYSNIIATTTERNTDRVWLWKDFKMPGRC